MAAVHGGEAGPPTVKLHVPCGRGHVHDVELPIDLLLCCGVPLAAQSCTTVWVATGVACASDVVVCGIAQVAMQTCFDYLFPRLEKYA